MPLTRPAPPAVGFVAVFALHARSVPLRRGSELTRRARKNARWKNEEPARMVVGRELTHQDAGQPVHRVLGTDGVIEARWRVDYRGSR